MNEDHDESRLIKVNEVASTIKQSDKSLINFIEGCGLPTDNILSPILERKKVFAALEELVNQLPMEQREGAYYLTKYSIAIAAGLFDGALNFLWNETIQALRRLVISYDIQYFYAVAEQVSKRYKNLTLEEEIYIISEYDLLDICRRIGLLEDMAFKQLENINYMRNHASAAHPNDNELTGYKMVSLTEDCLKYAITAQPDHSVIQIKNLFDNIRNREIPVEDFEIISGDLQKQPQERIDDLILSMFGIYCDERQADFVLRNIENLSKLLWNNISDNNKYIIGSKYGLYRKNGDVTRKNKTDNFLQIVDGLRYKDEDSLTSELIEKLQELRSTHYGFDNFYNERYLAQKIADSLPATGIPKAVKNIFVKTICLCYIGNGLGYRDGVDETAVVYYEQFINRFETEEIKEFISLLQDNEFTFQLYKQKPDERIRLLSEKLKTKSSNQNIIELLNKLINFYPRKLEMFASTKEYKDLYKNI